MPSHKDSPPSRPPKPSIDRSSPSTSPSEGDPDAKDTPLIRPHGQGLRSKASMQEAHKGPNISVSGHHISGSPNPFVPNPPQARKSWVSHPSELTPRQRTFLQIPGDTTSLVNTRLQRTLDAIMKQHKPSAPSPLGFEASMNDMDGADDDATGPERANSARAQRQRSLKVHVVQNDSTNVSELAQVGTLNPSGGPPSSLLVHDSSESMLSVRHDYSRYPQRKHSGFLGGQAGASQTSIRTYSSERVRTPASGSQFSDYIDPVHKNDPEGGYNPYVKYLGGIIFPALGEPEEDDKNHDPKCTEKLPSEWKGSFPQWMNAVASILTLAAIILGVIALFIITPLMVQLDNVRRQATRPYIDPNWINPDVDFPHLKNLHTTLIDPATPEYAYTRNSVLGKGTLKLAFSDEFNTDGRTFYPGEDQFWEAPNYHYAATNDMEWYDPDAVITANGTLQLQFDTHRNHKLSFRSGMLHSWNKMCFKGGVMEVSASLAGPAGVPGLWPGIWSLGNLARPGYLATTDGVWPYSYNQCDVGITPNQSSPDGMSHLPGQRLASCTCEGEDHPNPGTGRGAPEIDALEGTAYNIVREDETWDGLSEEEKEKRRYWAGVITQSVQLAPFDVWYQPDLDYVAINNYSITQMNSWQGGHYQQALSGVTVLNNTWYDGFRFQKYAFEYIPGGADGQVAWFVGDEETFRMSGNAIGPNGNVGQRETSHEPMSVILNLGLSQGWTWINWEKLAPFLQDGTTMHIDYVRIYQEEDRELVTCDPPGYETTKYISDHPKAYNNWNMTLWDDTGYSWPKNDLMDKC